MGILANVYRSDYDCTLNAFYGCQRLVIVNCDGPFEPSATEKPAMIVKGYYAGSAKVVPASLVDGEWIPNLGGMMGGTYCNASDSRFLDTVEKVAGFRWLGALAIHDRFEGGN